MPYSPPITAKTSLLPRLLTLLLLLNLLFAGRLCAQALRQRTAAAVRAFTADPQMAHAVTSFTLLDAATGSTVYAYQGQAGLAPASCQKTITAASAFYLLGTRFHYHTLVSYAGSVEDGVLKGDLIIRGSGDPMLGSWRYPSTKTGVVLARWVRAVRAAGIRKIDGSVIGDASAFDTQMPPDGWIWQDMGNYYGAGTCALTWHENQYDLHLEPGAKPGDPVVLASVDPAVPLRFVNELTTGSAASGDRTYIYLAPYGHTAFLRGTAPAADKGFMVSGSVPDPALLCARSLAGALSGAGIAVTGGATTLRLIRAAGSQAPAAPVALDDYTSPRLDSIVYWFLHRSINLYGEQLIKTMALQKEERVCTDTGVAIEKRLWEQKGLDAAALHLIDGSGLSPGNRVTTAAMARVLLNVSRQSWYHTYYDCLPVIHGIRMKSGHINLVCSYAGFLEAAGGRRLIFSFIVNNYDGDTFRVQAKMFRVLDRIKG
jgi:D-alanyl-D-alanine carboxypeptidase/D-alanyl-D-alanine-endopeptidase (penicillin-binding protein 4)